MKTSLRKLRGFALNKQGAKDRRDLRPLPQLDELAQAYQVSFPLFVCRETIGRKLKKIKEKNKTKLRFLKH